MVILYFAFQNVAETFQIHLKIVELVLFYIGVFEISSVEGPAMRFSEARSLSNVSRMQIS